MYSKLNGDKRWLTSKLSLQRVLKLGYIMANFLTYEYYVLSQKAIILRVQVLRQTSCVVLMYDACISIER